MAKKTNSKKSSHRDLTDIDTTEEVMVIMKDMRKQLMKLGHLVKDQYEELDAQTKKKITTGIIAAGAVALTALGISRMMNKKKDEYEEDNEDDSDDDDDDDDD